jgi:Domain of unknown function (DUF4336)
MPARAKGGKGSRVVLEMIDEGIWLAEGGIVSLYGFPYPTRSVIARLDTGGLWVWSPIRLTADLRAEVEPLGPVAHLVSPNKIHHLFLREWSAAYPAARLWGPRSTIAKRRDLVFREPLEEVPPAEWQPVIDQAWFRGSPAMDEIVFLHRRSRMAIAADPIECFSQSFQREHWRWWQRPMARLDGITAKRPRAPLEWRLSFIDRRPARAGRDKALGWGCESVIMAHGEWQRSNGAGFIANALAWLGR